MSAKAMISVEDRHGNRQVMYLPDLSDMPAPDRETADRIAAEMLAEIVSLGVHPNEAPWVATALLVQRHHDTLAYQREAARRGVLAL